MGRFRQAWQALVGQRAVKSSDWPWADLIGAEDTSTGLAVSPEQSLRVSAVYAGVRLLAESVSSLPVDVIRREAGRRIEIDDDPVARLIAEDPNPEQDAPELWRTVMGWMLLRGNAYVYVERDRATGIPIGLWPLPATAVTVDRDVNRRLYYQIDLATEDTGAAVPNHVRVGQDNILHYRAFGTGLYGLSPISQVREAVATSVAAQCYMGRFYRNDARPGGVIQVPDNLSDAQYQRLEAAWKASHEGLSRSHLMAILEGGAKWESVGINPGDARFIETQKWETTEIARALGIPPHMIGDVERSTSWGSGIAEQGIGYVTYTLTPWITRLEWVTRRGLLAAMDTRLRVRWRVAGLQRGDTKSRYEAYATARQWGWLSTNDVRSMEDMNPVPGGDVYLQPLNMVEAGSSEPDEPPRSTQQVMPGTRVPADVAPTAAMVALFVPPGPAAQLAVPDGLAADDLHVTLAFLGEDLTGEQQSAAAVVVEAVAAQHQPLSGSIGGLGQFPDSGDGIPYWAAIDVPGLAELRHRLVEALAAAGVPVATDHGFTPHVTLTYGDPAPDVPEPVDARFEELTLKVGETRAAYPCVGIRSRTTRRSGEGRRRIAGSFAPMIADVDRRLAKLERAEVGKLVRSYLEARSTAAFLEAVEALYNGTVRARATDRWLPVMTAFAAEIAADAAGDVGGDPADLDRWVTAYVTSHVAYRVASAVGQLRAAVAEAADAAAAVTERLDKWVEQRPERTARWESTQLANAAAREQWRTAGVRTLRWVTSGADCPYCDQLDGAVVGIEAPFLAAGAALSDGDQQLTADRDTFHPPAHPGCTCEVVPA